MKNLILLCSFAIILVASCTSEIKNETTNSTQLNETIEQLANNYQTAWNNKDVETLRTLAADDGQFYGSDPSEIMDKTALMEMYTAFFTDTTSAYQYTVNMRKIKLADDGNSAIVMERITFPEWSPKMPMCQTAQFVKTNDDWKIDFICWGFIIKNESVTAINEVLE